ncbi:hypothetical protein RhiirC2_726112 [Rhizophagus irregularis]|uniref:Uncharacterized protein n=1 Tax=Rhizophagus irregularis TaxID=588596 RepID=A0A2N1P106_9GLOM|nr:hypothetical protein RhiirC2_726112 [Rhizophagus irregularis]
MDWKIIIDWNWISERRMSPLSLNLLLWKNVYNDLDLWFSIDPDSVQLTRRLTRN